MRTSLSLQFPENREISSKSREMPIITRLRTNRISIVWIDSPYFQEQGGYYPLAGRISGPCIVEPAPGIGLLQEQNGDLDDLLNTDLMRLAGVPPSDKKAVVPTQNSESQRIPGIPPAFRVLSKDTPDLLVPTMH